MKIIRFIILTALFLVLQTNLQAKEWRGITPLKSTRADVERLLGKPNERYRYEFEEERAYINYVQRNCEKDDDDCTCFVSHDVVYFISVTIEVPMSFSKLKLDKTKYERFQFSVGNQPVQATYSNDEEGISYTVDEDDDITHIDYLPSDLDCSEIKERSHQ